MSLVSIRDDVVTRIRAAIPAQTIRVEAHPGRFDEEEIKRLANATPAILTSLMRVKSLSGIDTELHFVSWVFARANSADKKYNAALELVSRLIPALIDIDVPNGISSGEDIEAECLYSGALDKLNITLWAVKWKLTLGGTISADETVSFDDLENFEGYTATHKIGAADVEDIVDLEEDNGDTI